MTRNNSERLSNPVVEPNLTNPINSPGNSTVFVELPSRGLFYPEGHPLSGKTHMELKLMTLAQQDIISNRSYIATNTVYNKLLESLITQPIDVDNLFVADKEALLLAARIDGFGEEYNFSTMCPVCGSPHKDSLNLETILDNSLFEEQDEVEYTPLGFKIKLKDKDLDVVLYIRPLTSGEIKELDTLDEKARKFKQPTQRSSNELAKIIYHVEGVESVGKLLPRLKPRHFSFIMKQYNKFTPSINKKIDIVCKQKDCGAEFKRDIVFSTELFWPE